MTIATDYVDHLYSLHPGRAAVTVGVDDDCNTVHPFVFENVNHIPIGLIGLAAGSLAAPTEVDIYHISTFRPGTGQGSEILSSLCSAADRYGVRLCLQALTQDNGGQNMTDAVLALWYEKYGFCGTGTMHREPLV
jgi:hypothetical protein